MTGRFGLSIRAAEAADAPALAALLEEGGIRLAASDLVARLGLARRAGGTILLADEWGPPSGVVELAILATLAERLPVGRIGLLLVTRDARRRGVGRLLVKAAAQAARASGCGSLLAADTSGEDGLAAFWDANGFLPSGRSLTRGLRKRSLRPDE